MAIKKIETLVNTTLRELLGSKKAFENAKIRIGIIGESGTGKSSLINTIAGKYIAEVGATETTQEAQEHTIKDTQVTYVDLPGCGTQRWPLQTYVQDLNLLTYDAFILVYSARIKENDIALFSQLRAHGKPIFVARNYYDVAIDGEQAKPPEARIQDDDLRERIRQDARKQLDASDAHVFVTASVLHKPHYEVDALQRAILESLDEIKALRGLSGMHAYSEDMLEEKRKAAKKIVHFYAAASAANAVNPLPGLDILADISILLAMAQHVLRTFGIDPQKDEKKLVRLLGAKGAKELLQYVSKRAIPTILKRFSGRLATAQATKWIPIVGQGASVIIGAAVAETFGNDCISRAYDAAKADMLDSAKTA